MFTKQHHEAIANIIKSEYVRFDNTGENNAEGKLTAISIAVKLSGCFEIDNPQFDCVKFLKACGFNWRTSHVSVR